MAGKKLAAVQKTIKDIDNDREGLARELWAKRLTVDQQIKFAGEGVNGLFLLLTKIQDKFQEEQGGGKPKSAVWMDKPIKVFNSNANVGKFIEAIKRSRDSANKACDEYWKLHNGLGNNLLQRCRDLDKLIKEIIVDKQIKSKPKSIPGLQQAQKDVRSLGDAVDAMLAMGAPKKNGNWYKLVDVKDSMLIKDLYDITTRELKQSLAEHEKSAKQLDTQVKKFRRISLSKALKSMQELAKEMPNL